MSYNPNDPQRPTIKDAQAAYKVLESVKVEDNDDDTSFDIDCVKPADRQKVDTAVKTIKRYAIDDNNGRVKKANVRRLNKEGVSVSDISGNPPDEDIHPDEHSGIRITVNDRNIDVDEVKLD